MALQDDIKKLLHAGGRDKSMSPLRSPWTTRDLIIHPYLSRRYAESFLRTLPANRSVPAPGMERLGTGHHVRNGESPLFVRVGKEDGAVLFELIEDNGSRSAVLRDKEELRQDRDKRETDGNEELSGKFTRITHSNVWKEQGDDYLNSDEFTKTFLQELTLLLGEGLPIAHCYRRRKAIKGEKDWQCFGILEAAARYRYSVLRRFHATVAPEPPYTLGANAKLLDHFQKELRRARRTMNESLAVSTAKDIQDWGLGARSGPNKDAIDQLATLNGGFLAYLNTCERSFGSGTSIDLKPFIGRPYGLRSNAGFTKIYALAFDNFVIYDSRVMAAIGLLVVRMLTRMGHIKTPVPASVAFLADNRDDIASARRNPNSNCLGINGFPLIAGANNDVCHLKWNIRANAMLTAAVHRSKLAAAVSMHPIVNVVNPLRAFEAALFMIGYDLGGNWPHHN